MIFYLWEGVKAHRFGFNGKENDNEIKGTGNQQDYGMRIYDPRLGRFLSVDPLTKNYPWYTPYQFAGNKPIFAIDLDGAEELPNEIYSAMKKAGKNLLQKGIKYLADKIVNTVYTKVNEKIEEKLDDYSTSSNHKRQMIGMYGEFMLGLGPDSRYFGPNEAITKSLKGSHLTARAVEKFAVGYNEFKKGDRPAPPSYYVAEFGIPLIDDANPLQEGTNAAQFVGSATYQYNYNEKSGVLNIKVLDDKNQWSYRAHKGERDSVNHERNEAGRSQKESTTYQVYEFSFTKEELKKAGISLK